MLGSHVVLDSNLLYGRRMTLITFSDGKVVMKGDAVGTEQACCCRCGCSLREDSVIVVTVDGNDVELFGLSGPIDVFNGDFGMADICSSSNAELPDSYCESRLGSTGWVTVHVGCHDADWEGGFPGDPFPYYPPPIPENWPSSGIVVAVSRFWGSHSIYWECDGGKTEDRYFYYRMNCDHEGYPTTGELFYDSGVIEYGDVPYGCFDCTNEPEINRDCESLSAPSSVSFVVNPLP